MSSFARAISIDYRSLRFCRAAVGLMTLVHVGHLVWDLEAFFTDQGLIPYDLITYGGRWPFFFSFFYFARGEWMAWLHFAGLALCGLGLVFNRFPRLSSFGAYVLTISISNRMAFALYGVDYLFATIFLWFSFLPPGKPAGSESNSFSSLAGLAALLQIAYLYAVAGFLKSYDYWFVKGYGAYTALQADLYARPLGLWVANHVPLPVLQFSSRAVLIWERFGPLLIFSPWGFVWCRLAVFAGFALMHLSFAATMAIGTFPGVDLAFLILLIPGEVWDSVSAKIAGLPRLRTFARVETPLDIFAPVILAALFCVTVWNLKRLDFRIWVPGPVKWAAKNLSLNQNWGMFAPTPFTRDGWYVLQGVTSAGHAVDVLQNRIGWADFRKPESISSVFPSERWVSNANSFFGREGEENRRAFASFYCRRWRKDHGESLKDLRIWYVAETTVEPGEFQPSINTLLYATDCSE